MSSVHSESLDPAALGFAVRHEPVDVTSKDGSRDLLVARAGGLAEWCGDRLHAFPPVVAAFFVAVVGWLAVTATIVAIGALVVHLVVPGAVGSWDVSFVRTLAEHRTAPLTDASWVGSGLAETLTVVAVGLALTVFLLVKRAWALVGVVVLALVMEITVYLAVTNVIHRNRPFVVQLERRREGASFPSGHTAAAVVLYFLIAVVVSMYVTNALTRRIAWTAVVVVPIVVALSRIYRGMHHPTDAIAGFLMGAGCVVVALLAVRTAGVVAARRSARAT